MSRTRADFEAITATAVSSLTLSSSAVAQWKWLRDMGITVALFLDGIWQLFQADIDTALSTKQPGTLGWYQDIARAYQYGDSLSIANGVLYYAVPDVTKQIVTQASVREVDDELILLKVAKTVSGVITPLSGTELTAFGNYMTARRIPGVKTNWISYAPDSVYYELDVRYDARYDQTALDAAVQAALAAYRDTLPFDAVVYKTKILAAVCAVPGVLDAVGTLDAIFSSGGSVSDFYDSVELPAGYFNWDGSAFITYLAQ